MSSLAVLKALSDESRLRLVHVLGDGPFNVQELTNILSLSQPTVSHHLKVLERAGIARSKREGTWIYYGLVNGDAKGSPASEITQSFLSSTERETDSSLKDYFSSDKRKAESVLARRRDSAHRYFESVAQSWKRVRTEAHGGDIPLNLLIQEIPSDASLVELGCGSGALLERLLPRSGRTIGVDYSQSMLDEANQNLKALGLSVETRLGALEHLPLADGSVDIALAYMVLHHLSDPKEALRDTYRVLRPGGKLVIVDLTKHHDEGMRERFADLWLGFEPKDFKEWLTGLGFINSRVTLFGEKKEIFLLVSNKPSEGEDDEE